MRENADFLNWCILQRGNERTGTFRKNRLEQQTDQSLFYQTAWLVIKSLHYYFTFQNIIGTYCPGKTFPELNYTDQNHFIKEVKKFSGVVPKELSKNKNDRFVLLSVLKGK